MDIDRLLDKYDRQVPRYTSYPTAPHFSDAVDSEAYVAWLRDLPAGDALSLLRRDFIGFVFQGFHLLARTSALENVELPLVYRGVSTTQRRAQARAALRARPSREGRRQAQAGGPARGAGAGEREDDGALAARRAPRGRCAA